VQHAVDALGILPAEIGLALDTAPARRALLTTVVASPGLVMPDLAATRPFEALGSALVCLHFRHVSLLLGGRGEPCLFLIRDVVLVLEIINRRIPRGHENHGHVSALDLRHGFDLAVVGNLVIETFQDVATEFRMGHLSTPEPHGAFDFVALPQELHDSLPLDVEVTRPDLRPELDFLDDGAGLVLAGFPCLDGLVVFVLAVVHHPHNRRTSIGGDLDQIESELGGKPSSLVDVFLAYLGTIRRDQAHARNADSVVDPWLCDESTSWFILVFAQEDAFKNKGSTTRCRPMFGT